MKAKRIDIDIVIDKNVIFVHPKPSSWGKDFGDNGRFTSKLSEMSIYSNSDAGPYFHESALNFPSESTYEGQYLAIRSKFDNEILARQAVAHLREAVAVYNDQYATAPEPLKTSGEIEVEIGTKGSDVDEVVVHFERDNDPKFFCINGFLQATGLDPRIYDKRGGGWSERSKRFRAKIQLEEITDG